MALSEKVRETFSYFDNKARSYALTFQKSQPANLEVLNDLARFCRANESTAYFDGRTHAYDPYMSAKLDGRREVWLHIQQYIHLTPEQLMQLYVGNPAGVYTPTEK